MSKSLFLEPVDVWLFRDGKPFNAGADHHADSLFPPLPSVIQGALRSHYLVLRGIDLSSANQARIIQEVGTAIDFRDLRLRGPFIRKGSELFFPLPADAFLDEDQGKYRTLALKAYDSDVAGSDLLPMMLSSEAAKPAKFEAGYVSQSEWQNYVAGEPFAQTSANELFQRELRTGIARDDDKRVTREGALYSVNYIRACGDVGLHVEMEGLNKWQAQAGVLRIGGEGHGARFSVASLKSTLPVPKIGSLRKFKLVLLTPTFFDEGWRPSNWDRHFTGKVTLQAAALHRFISAGGYDWAKNDHKPALRYVPAGSVYYFSADEAVELRNEWLCDPSPDGATIGQIGFGQVTVIKW